MYRKQEAGILRKEFWTSFGRYLAPIHSAEGEKINWINYRTGVKDFRIRMDADNKKAYIGLELVHSDPDWQQLYFEQLEKLRTMFRQEAGDDWIWQLHGRDAHGKIISRIYAELDSVHILRRDDWPALIRFFKERIIALDAFWSSAKEYFVN